MKNYENRIASESNCIVAENDFEYSGQKYPFQKETYELIGLAMDVHRYLGRGFSEIVYKDALQEEFKRKKIGFEREKKYEIEYRGIILPHHFFADFVIENKVILEVKAQAGIHEQAAPQVINYLAASKLSVGLILNFGESSLKYKRVVLSHRKDNTDQESKNA